MPKKKDYTTAKNKLDQIIAELEGDTVSIDELTKKVKEAKELVEWCKERLRSTQAELIDSEEH